MAAARSTSTVYATPVDWRPGSISARIDAGIFGARIVAGGDDEIAAFARCLTHFGALGAVAIAAAAEERDDARAGSSGDLAGERSQIAERVVGMRVVDDHGEWLARIDGLEAAGNGLERWNRTGEMRERNAARVGGGEGREKVEDVDFAGQTRGEAGRAGGSFELNSRAGRRERVA